MSFNKRPKVSRFKLQRTKPGRVIRIATVEKRGNRAERKKRPMKPFKPYRKVV